MNKLLAAGLVLSSATQLRPDGIGIGPGEALLALWSMLAARAVIARNDFRASPALSRIAVFWSLYITSLCIGSINGFLIGDIHDPKWFLHDVVGYSVVVVATILMLSQPNAGDSLRRAAVDLVAMGSVFLLAQIGMGFGLLTISDIDPWEWDRLRGLTDNANQLALVCLILAGASLHLFDTARGARKLLFLLGFATAAAAGVMSKSDAFSLGIAVSLIAYLGMQARTGLLRLKRNATPALIAILVTMAAPTLLAYVTISGVTGSNALSSAVASLRRAGDTAEAKQTTDLRFEIWKAAVHRGIDASALGLGPGPHLEIPPSIVAGRRSSTNDPKYVEHPKLGVAPNFEAHNTFLDLFLQGGALAVISLLWLGGSTMSDLVRAGRDGLAALLFGLCAFATFHLIVRHPIVWFAVALCLTAVSPSSRRLWVWSREPPHSRPA